MASRLRITALALSAAGLAFIGLQEGQGPTTAKPTGEVVAQAYPDPALGWAVPTICQGHTRGVFRGQQATLGQCQAWLQEDTAEAGRYIRRCTTAAVTQAQYDVLVDFVHNVGGPTYCASQLVRALNAGDCHGAARQINAAPQIDRATGQPRRWAGSPIKDRATGQILLATGAPVMKFTTSGGQPLPGLINRRAAERAKFEPDCAAWE